MSELHEAGPGPDAELTCRIIGLGGIGQVVGAYVSLFLSGRRRPARIVLVDGDAYEERNESRTFVGDLDNKAAVVQADLADRLGPGPVTLVAVGEYVGEANIDRLVRSGPGEVTFLCVDNHATRKLVADHASRLDDICLISGGNDGVGPDGSGVERAGTAGNVQIHVRRGGRDLTPPLTRYHPEIAAPADRRPDEQSCGELLASGAQPQILFTNVAAASWMMATFWRWLEGTLDYGELVFDIGKARAAPLMV